MKIALVHDARFPVQLYGGTERVVWWLAKGLREQGKDVVLICGAGSECPYAEVRHADPTQSFESQFPDVSLFHYWATPSFTPTRAHVVTIEGNGKLGEAFLPNTIFVSHNHARRHGAEAFVYNGVDPDDYIYREDKDRDLLFLAKASWRVKNVKGAIRIARRAGRPLRIAGGKRFLFNHWRGIHWEGMLGGEKKRELVSRSAALLFPVLWNEPFGVAVVEALVSGTPVLASPYGSLPELVGPGVGKICASESEFIDVIARIDEYRAADCRAWALEKFHYRGMTTKYLEAYERVLAGEKLNTGIPKATEPPLATFVLRMN